MESKEDLANTVNDENYQILLELSRFLKTQMQYRKYYDKMRIDRTWVQTEEYFANSGGGEKEEDEKKDEVGGLVEEISALSIEEKPLILALDCEMCEYRENYSTGKDLIRLSVVGFDLANLSNDLDVMSETICNSKVLLDVLVKPAHDVTNMCTRFHQIRLFILF